MEHNGYPMLSKGVGTVFGEVYQIPDEYWPELHAWEEYPNVYECAQHQLDDGRWVWIYRQADAEESAMPRRATGHNEGHSATGFGCQLKTKANHKNRQ